MKKLVLVGISAAVAISAIALVQKDKGSVAATAAVGSKAPNFTLKDSNGKTHSLSDFAGKLVVLEWTNHDCPIVVRHYNSGNMQKQQKWAKDNGVVWLSIVSSAPGKQGHIDGDQANMVMKEKKHVVAGMLLDTDSSVGKLYGAKTTPHMYVVSPKGELIYNGGIDDNPRGAESANVRNHVIEALKEAMAGKKVSVASSQPYGCSVKYP